MFAFMGIAKAVKQLVADNGKSVLLIRTPVSTSFSSQIDRVFSIATQNGYSPYNINCVHFPSADDIVGKEEIPDPESIDLDKLKVLDKAIEGTVPLFVFNDYDAADEETREFIRNSINRRGFTRDNAFPEGTLCVLIASSEKKTGETLLSLPFDRIEGRGN